MTSDPLTATIFPLMIRRTFLAVAIVLCCAAPIAAHPAPFSYLDVVFRNGGIDGTLVVHIIDVAHDLGIAPVERMLDDRLVQSQKDAIGSLLQPRILFRTDRRLTLDWQSVEVMKEEQALRLKYRITTEEPGALTID